MRQLLLSAASPLALLALPAAAQTTVSANTSSSIATATAASGSPSDVVIASGVTVTPPSGTAITVNSSNSATNNGTLTFTDVSNTTGIAAQPGFAGTIANPGTITVTETAVTNDENGDGFNDAAFATGSNRYGIHLTGPGTFTGGVSNAGTITVVGNASAGIASDGTLAGTLANTGTISVSGTGSYGIHTGAVTGDVTSGGTVAVTGQGAVGIAVDGDVGGTVSITGAVSVTGFRGGAAVYTAPVADDLLIGGPAVRVTGNVAGGVSIVSGASVTSYGSAPALVLGSAGNANTIGLVSGSTYGLVLAGTLTGSGVNVGVPGAAITIGQGAPVTVTGGISLTGTVAGTANQAAATGIVLASGVSTPTLDVTGSLTAVAGSGGFGSQAVLVAAGANLPVLNNSGTISAGNSGATGTAVAIVDQSGTLATINNTGTIKAALSGTYDPSLITAIDLSANTGGVAINQALASSTSTVTPAITGRIITGSGNDTITASAGVISGAVSLGAGNNAIALSGTAQLLGAVDFGSGTGTLALAGKSVLAGDLTFGAGSSMSVGDTASFTGAIVQNGNPLALTLASGSFNATNTGTIALSSLSVGSAATLRVNIDATAGTHTLYAVGGTANIASGATLALDITHFLPGAQSFAVVTAGTLTGGTGLAIATTSLPYIYTAGVTANAAAGTISLSLAPKTAAQLGLNRSGTAAYPAVYAAIQTSSAVSAAFLTVADNASFQHLYGEMLPDHAGGTFLGLAAVSRAVADFETDPTAPRATTGRLGLWVLQTGSIMHKAQDDTQAYNLADYALGIGVEYALGGFGTVGVGYDWSYNHVTNADAGEVTADRSEIGAYWRGRWGGLRLHANGAWGHVGTSSRRELSNPSDAANPLETATANWGATTTTAGGGAAYELRTGRIALRPAASVDLFRLDDAAHTETGGDSAYDLAIAERRSRAVTGTYTLTAGYTLSSTDDHQSRIELELGTRQRLSGGIADTVANFAAGQSFTLQADALRYGPLAKLRFAVGSDAFSILAEARAERTEGEVAAGLTAGLRVRL